MRRLPVPSEAGQIAYADVDGRNTAFVALRDPRDDTLGWYRVSNERTPHDDHPKTE